MKVLPWEVIVKILCRLPVKDLLQYRCVSKPWRSLIDGPGFINMHLKNSMATKTHLGIIVRHLELYWVDLETLHSAVKLTNPIHVGGRIQVLGCSNGLLLLANSNGDIALWNPSTRRYRKLPITSDTYECIFSPPIVEHNVIGFGYDPVTDEYKLLKMKLLSRSKAEFKVYNVKSNTWKELTGFRYNYSYQHGNVLVCNTLYWIVRKPNSNSSKFIVAFDLVTEEYREFSVPNCEDEPCSYKLVELGGCLCVVCCYSSDNTKLESLSDHVDIWVMKEIGVSEPWTKLFSVAPSNETGPFSYAAPITYLKGTEQVLMNVDCRRFIVYDLETKRARNVRVSGVPFHFETHFCVSSLVGVDGCAGENTGTQDSKNEKHEGEKREERKKGIEKQPIGKKRDDFLSEGFKLVL